MSRIPCVLLAAAVASGISSASGLELGQSPGPVKLVTLTGEGLVMDNYGERPATAMLFLSARCDATERAIAEINRLYRKYRLRDVLFVGVCSNPAETGDELRTFAQRRGTIFPVYRDPTGAVASQLGARATPEVFLHDDQGVLVFHGGLHDDEARRAFETAIVGVLHTKPLEAESHGVEGTPMNQPGPKREIEDPYESIAFSSELVFEKIPFAAAHHCSTI